MNATILKKGLQDYVAALERQLAELRVQSESIDRAWGATRAYYQGEGADAFEGAFARVRNMLDKYMDMLMIVIPMLKDRLDSLERFDATNQPRL